MSPQEADISDLERRVAQLEKELARIGERATRREDEWGSVRSRAEKVDALRDEVRELRHLVGRPAGSGPAETTAAVVPPVEVAPAPSTQSIVDAVMARLKGQSIPTTKAEATALLKQAILDDQQVRETVIAWLLQDLQNRGISIPPPLRKRPGARG